MSPPSPPEFEYAFDPALSSLFPPAADLFSPSETTNLLGFLDNFNWDFELDGSLPDVPLSPLLPLPSPVLPPCVVHDSPVKQQEQESTLAPGRTRPFKRKSTCDTHQPVKVKPLLSTPQKRLNHIMSEQKRRNAIRDGYAQLISLIAPAGTHAIDMPSRGRPKGSGSNSKGHTKGKSGVLFRAAEYCRWLEEGRDALKEEVLLLEAAAGIVSQH